jgi:hypothetical protein
MEQVIVNPRSWFLDCEVSDIEFANGKIATLHKISAYNMASRAERGHVCLLCTTKVEGLWLENAIGALGV